MIEMERNIINLEKHPNKLKLANFWTNTKYKDGLVIATTEKCIEPNHGCLYYIDLKNEDVASPDILFTDNYGIVDIEMLNSFNIGKVKYQKVMI